jgi:hypothetical protein
LRPGARVALLAMVLDSDAPPEPSRVAMLAVRRPGESPLVAVPASPLDWMPARRGLRPMVPGEIYERAASKVGDLRVAGAADAPPVADALHLAAARAFVEASAGESAAAAIDGMRSWDRATKSLAKATAWHAIGEPERGLVEVENAPTGTAWSAAALAVARAELLASAGRDEAGKAALAADALAEKSGDHALDVRARWDRLALARESPLRAAPPAAIGPLERSSAWPWVGLYGVHAEWFHVEAESRDELDVALARWNAARAATPAEQLAVRFGLLDHRGDTPVAPAAYASVAASLLPAAGGDVEIWLDAFLAVESHTLPMRTYAWLRAESARWRHDARAAAAWSERRKAHAALAAKMPEFATILGL